MRVVYEIVRQFLLQVHGSESGWLARASLCLRAKGTSGD